MPVDGRVDAVVVARRQVDDGAGAAVVTLRFLVVAEQLRHSIWTAFHEERRIRVDRAHRLDASVGRADDGLAIVGSIGRAPGAELAVKNSSKLA